MNQLTAILFGTPSLPENFTTRHHRCGDKDRITSCVGIKPSKKSIDGDGANDNQAKVLACVLRSKNPITSTEVSAKTGLSKSYCNITLAKMWSNGKVIRNRIRVRDVSAYVYEAA